MGKFTPMTAGPSSIEKRARTEETGRFFFSVCAWKCGLPSHSAWLIVSPIRDCDKNGEDTIAPRLTLIL